MISIDWVTNIPTPYRNYLHGRMAAIFPEFDLRFRVSYMAWTEHDRHWSFEPADFGYEFQVYRGLHPRFSGGDLHFNPGLLAERLGRPADVLVVGGYATPTGALVPWLSRARLRVLYSESHEQSSRWAGGPAGWLKRSVAGRYHAFIVPGAPQRRFIRSLVPDACDEDFIRLPNLIDPRVFSQGVAALRDRRLATRAEFGLPEGDRIWLCPARLEPAKGLPGFLPHLEGLRGVTLAVVGDGTLRRELEQLVRDRSLPVRFLGQQAQDAMQRLYAASDVFVLPSLRDPSPLSPIEACAAGVPLLVSSRIGNLDDVLDGASNGWSFDPEDAAQVRRALAEAAGASDPSLAERARASERVFRESFDPDACVAELARGLLRCLRVRN